MSKEDLRSHVDGIFNGMRQKRASWNTHWRMLSDYILPRRYRWLVQANQASRGNPINERIIDSTGTLAARVLASGMMAGITSPTRPWFKFRIEGFEDDNLVGQWLAECERRMMHVFAESNFYTAMATMYFDLVVFGSACIIIYEDFENVIHCFTPCLGEFFFELNDKFEVNTVAREIALTNLQTSSMFGDSVSEDVKRAVQDPRSADALRERLICHIIEPNDDNFDVVPKIFPWREVYWEAGTTRDAILRSRGFRDWPCMTPRWDVTANDPYGRSPGMDALGDIKQLQQEQKRKGQAIDKMVNPPMIADVQLKNQPASTMPGGWTYVAGLNSGRDGARPLYTVQPPLADIKQDIQEVQSRIKITFHNDLFTGITDLQTVRTATEIDARREEKLVLLGPVLERILGEGLGRAIDRVWGIMLRGQILPPPPQALAGPPTAIRVDYVSMLAMAQRGLATAAIEKLWGFAGNISAVRPTVLDSLNEDTTIEEYAAALGVSPRLLRGEREIAAIRDAQAKQQQAAALAQAIPPAADAAKTLSDTDVGGGINALQLALGSQNAQPV